MGNVVAKIAYMPVSLTLSAGAGLLSGVLFKQVWAHVGRSGDAPSATDESKGWVEVLAAAVLHGAIFAVVKAAAERAGATGVRKLTGFWPV
jgi:hypothetical protein